MNGVEGPDKKDDINSTKFNNASAIHKELENTKTKMLKILKSAQILTKTYETFAEQLQSLSEQVTSFSINTELYPKEPIIESFAQSLLLFAKPFKDLFKVWQEKMTIPMEKFVKEDFGIYLEQLNDLRAKVLKSMETYRKVKTETEKFKNKTLKTKKVMELEAAVTGFHTMTNEYADQLRTMTSISRLQFNHILLSAVEVYFQHFENGKDIKNELASQYLLQRSEIEEEKEELEKREATYKRNLRFKSSDPEAKHGFLYLKFSTARRPWKMRHIIVNNNILKVYKLWKENSDTTVDCEFDLKICTIKAFPDKQPYCFEIIHAQRRPVVFRARNQTDYQGWLQIIQAAIAGAIISIDYFSQKRLSVMPQLSEALLLIRQEQSNLHCAECSASDPSWTSINTGAKICIECAGIHRSLGTHDSKVRSLTMDNFPFYLVRLLESLPNSVVNSIYEAIPLSGAVKPSPDADLETRKKWIHMKYTQKLFVQPYNGTPEQLQAELVKCILADDVPSLIKCIAQGAKVEDSWQGKSLLLCAIESGLPVIAEALILSDAKLNSTDCYGKTAVHYAIEGGDLSMVKLLVGHDVDLSVKDNDGIDPVTLAMNMEKAQEDLDFKSKYSEIEKYISNQLGRQKQSDNLNTQNVPLSPLHPTSQSQPGTATPLSTHSNELTTSNPEAEDTPTRPKRSVTRTGRRVIKQTEIISKEENGQAENDNKLEKGNVENEQVQEKLDSSSSVSFNLAVSDNKSSQETLEIFDRKHILSRGNRTRRDEENENKEEVEQPQVQAQAQEQEGEKESLPVKSSSEERSRLYEERRREREELLKQTDIRKGSTSKGIFKKPKPKNLMEEREKVKKSKSMKEEEHEQFRSEQPSSPQTPHTPNEEKVASAISLRAARKGEDVVGRQRLVSLPFVPSAISSDGPPSPSPLSPTSPKVHSHLNSMASPRVKAHQPSSSLDFNIISPRLFRSRSPPSQSPSSGEIKKEKRPKDIQPKEDDNTKITDSKKKVDPPNSSRKQVQITMESPRYPKHLVKQYSDYDKKITRVKKERNS